MAFPRGVFALKRLLFANRTSWFEGVGLLKPRPPLRSHFAQRELILLAVEGWLKANISQRSCWCSLTKWKAFTHSWMERIALVIAALPLFLQNHMEVCLRTVLLNSFKRDSNFLWWRWPCWCTPSCLCKLGLTKLKTALFDWWLVVQQEVNERSLLYPENKLIRPSLQMCSSSWAFV